MSRNSMRSIPEIRDRLTEISIDELEKLIREHPFCQNLYYLLLQKKIAAAGGHNLDRTLALTSTYSTDRSFLFDLMTRNESKVQLLPKASIADAGPASGDAHDKEQFVGSPEPNSESEAQRSIRPITFDEGPNAHPKDASEPVDEIFDDFDYPEEDPPTSFQDFIDPDTLMPEEDEGGGLSMLEKIIEATPSKMPPFKMDLFTTEFLSTYLKIIYPAESTNSQKAVTHEKSEVPFEITNVPLSNTKEVPRTSKLKKPFVSKTSEQKELSELSSPDDLAPDQTNQQDIENFADKSVMENTEIASETLAELLIAQEQYEKAIRMYKRLILIFPQKSSYFEGKIKSLNKLLSS